MNVNVVKFFDIYDRDAELRERLKEAERFYPGSLELREAVVEDILLPEAEALGCPFTVKDLQQYELAKHAAKSRDVELTDVELAARDEDEVYWLVNRGWESEGHYQER